jgi:type I restriction enzyme S subunit
MSFPKYLKYRKGGVAWTNELPAHWDASSLKWVCERFSGGTPDKNKQEYWENGTIPWLNSGAVNSAKIREPSTYITQEALDNSSAKWVPQGALLMALAGQGKTKGTVAQLMFDATCNQSMAAIVPCKRVGARYLYWWLACNYQNIRNMAGGDLRDGLNLDLLGTIPCPLPPNNEQTAIASFLDRETAKIDSLIAEQERLIALLSEKRLATISHAVTRGLNPDVPMKESGAAWLGEVPAHWEVKPFRYCVDYQEGPGILANDFHDEGVPLLRVAGVQDQWASLTGCNHLDPKKVARRWEHFRLQRGDLLISASASMGTVCEVGDEAVGAIAYTGIIRLRGKAGQMIKPFIRHLVVSSQFLTQIDQLKAGATIQHFGPTHLSQMFVVRPPEEEQQAIAAFVDDELERLGLLRSAAEHAIALLSERRSALIAAAVTGQIDVRGVMAQQINIEEAAAA